MLSYLCTDNAWVCGAWRIGGAQRAGACGAWNGSKGAGQQQGVGSRGGVKIIICLKPGSHSGPGTATRATRQVWMFLHALAHSRCRLCQKKYACAIQECLHVFSRMFPHLLNLPLPLL
jgi:hypothetical protein